MFVTIVIFLVIIAVAILAHEMGHYTSAKLSGVKVEELGFGFPPRLLSFKRGETVYSLNAIPLGGFTKLLGEEDPTMPDSLASKSIATRFMVLSAGSLMNILLPLLIFAIIFMVPHDTLSEKVLIKEVATGSPAQSAGIEPGDIILEIDERTIQNRGDVAYSLHLNMGSEVDILLQKPDFSHQEVHLTPRWNPPEGQGAIGVAITGTDSTIINESYPVWKAVPLGLQHSWEILVLFRNEVLSWIIGGKTPMMAGPIGIAQLTGEVAKGGPIPLLEFAALINISLAIINLFPFPGLDGGRIFFLFLEWIRRGKRISPQKEGLAHLIGFIILILILAIVSYYDIVRIISGESFLP